MFNIIVKANHYAITNTATGKTIRRKSLIDAAKVVFENEVTIHEIKVAPAANLVELYNNMCKIAYKFCK
ncbi:hypothetical protein PS2_265 [Serratia phage PS2]|uniref:Uncharacterized protein n=1 Tax=Serratia phage PS2 TaxID=1481112 RepID=A0A023W620_9CAUD|nr:hypothetical protein FF83_gp150 [Serratia phage PS2]AHY25503.1 hypothetical protein PS2_265 [Serratia phage PS2]WDS61797.1 hypothetical protein [Cronobacter phage vB_Cdu_VP8]